MRMLMALDAMALKFALANERELPGCSWFPLKASINSCLCSLRANAASTSWLAAPLLLLPLACLVNSCSRSSLRNLWANAESSSWPKIPLLLTLTSLFDTLDGRMLRLLKSVLVLLSGLWRSASRLFKAPAAFLALTSWGKRSCIVFHSTVFTVQDLPLLQIHIIKHSVKKCATIIWTTHNKISRTDWLKISWIHLISCLHLGHFFPHLSAADRKHFLQKLQAKKTSQNDIDSTICTKIAKSWK